MLILGIIFLLGLVAYIAFSVGYDSGHLDGTIAEMAKNRKEKAIWDMKWNCYKEKVLK
jgi:hypothetical protein